MIEKVVWLFGRAMSLLKQWAMSRISLLDMTHLATYNIIPHFSLSLISRA
jgi:hypothetical protein